MKLGLEGKAALITGGSKGIGFATALQLAREGASVAIAARTEAHLVEAAQKIKDLTGIEVFFIAADVSKAEDCVKIVFEAAQHFGRLDLVVNNAGTAAARPFDAVGDDLWNYDLDLKLHAAIRISRAALPYMRKSGGGSIVNITTSSSKTPSASSLPSNVSRAAGLALTKAMSRDLAPDHIRVNTVCIGSIRSDQVEKRWKKESPDISWDEFSRNPDHKIPLGRIGEAEEAANVITFLLSEAAAYVTGTAVNVDGGTGASL